MLAVPEIEWRLFRHVEQQRVFLAAFDPGVHVRQRRFEVVADVLVELVVLLGGDLGLGARPQRRRLIDLFVLVRDDLRLRRRIPLFFLHHDRHRDVVGVLPQDLSQLEAGQQFVFLRTQVEHDVRAA